MHFIYDVSRLTTTKVDSTYLGGLTNNRYNVYVSGRVQTHDHSMVAIAPCLYFFWKHYGI